MTQKRRRLSQPIGFTILIRGFTLIELMVVVAIVAVLGTLAAPSMSNLISQNRISAQINSFVSDLQWARSEAIKRGVPIVVCASSNGTSCLANNKWEGGWLAFADANSDGVLDATESVIKIRSPWKGGDTFQIAKPATSPPTSISFSRDGFAVAANQLEFELKPASGTARCLQFGTTGRMKVIAGACA